MRQHRYAFLLLALIAALAFAPVSAQDAPPPTTADETPTFWWNDRVFYEIFVRSFYDTTGDGIGDLQGVIAKLDYLEWLGVNGIWLMPINPSPSYHGYDVTDYRDINPDYGTIDDFKQLMAEARARDIAIIVDLVINHTSSQHPWFLASLAGDPEYADWYIWADENPGWRGPDGQQVWHPRGGRYFYGVFWSEMPDLNLTNPAVTAEIYDITRWWLEEMGVDGFRLDAIKHLIEDGNRQENTPQTRQWLADYHAFVKSINPDAVLVGELWSPSVAIAPYIGDKVDIAFEFDLAGALIRAGSFGIVSPLASQLETVFRLYPPGQYATFLANHDQNRVMNQVGGNIDGAKMAATLLLTLPGVPFIYYGEEIGMTGMKPDEKIRTPMHWNDRPFGGFTTSNRPWQPLNPEYTRGVSVAVQQDDPDSLLTHYRTLIQTRRANSALLNGDFERVNSSATNVLSFLRHNDEQTVLVIINLGRRPVESYALTLDAWTLPDEVRVTPILGADEIAPLAVNESGGFSGYAPVEALAPFQLVIIGLE